MAPFARGWMQVEQIELRAFEAMIRRAKWHFVWMHGCYSRRGFGTTEQKAIGRALERAVKSVSIRFNVAEFDSLYISRFLGFYVANVKINARQILQNTALNTSYLQRQDRTIAGVA